MAIGSQAAGSIGKANTHVGPTIGSGKSAGQIGNDSTIFGSALTLDQNKTKTGYPTTTTGT